MPHFVHHRKPGCNEAKHQSNREISIHIPYDEDELNITCVAHLTREAKIENELTKEMMLKTCIGNYSIIMKRKD